MPRSRGPLAPFLVLLALAGAAVACGTVKSPVEPTDGPDPSATFSRVQAEVFTPSCAVAGCHGGSSPQLGLDLSAGKSWASIVNVRSVEATRLRVAPGDPDASYLVSKVKGDATITGSRMPLGGALTPAEIDLIVDWVRRGAPND